MEPAIVTSPPGRTQDSGRGRGFATPILLVVFNRPQTTKSVFESIRAIQPTELYVAADGPRPNAVDEHARCLESRLIATAVDWDCIVQTRFREKNAGLAVNMSEAITWFFQNVESGIILEDDCVPSRSFYRFCQELLGYYSGDSRVMHISGNNFQYGRRRGDGSYYFSNYALVWGWATWRRAWRLYDFSLRPSWKLQDTWDTQWQLSLEKHAGLAITPQANLVTNVGFGPDASHTRTMERYSFLPAATIDFPLTHPQRLAADREADLFTYYSQFRNVAHLDFIWLYRFWDGLYAVLRQVKKQVLRRIHP